MILKANSFSHNQCWSNLYIWSYFGSGSGFRSWTWRLSGHVSWSESWSENQPNFGSRSRSWSRFWSWSRSLGGMSWSWCWSKNI